MPAAVFCSLIRRLGPVALCAALAAPLLVGLWGCDGKKPAAPAMTPVEVTALEIKPQSAP